jgi:hypothetical protein
MGRTPRDGLTAKNTTRLRSGRATTDTSVTDARRTQTPRIAMCDEIDSKYVQFEIKFNQNIDSGWRGCNQVGSCSILAPFEQDCSAKR